MKMVLILAGALALVGIIVVVNRRQQPGKNVVPLGESGVPDWAVPLPAPGNPTNAMGKAEDYCRRIYGKYSESVGMVPDKRAVYVQKGYEVVENINCGTVKYAEKAVGAFIVTPAKKLWNSIF